jgi:uncharacterized protein DUF4399
MTDQFAPRPARRVAYRERDMSSLEGCWHGMHTLQLVLGDPKHYPFNPPVISKKITITVK